MSWYRGNLDSYKPKETSLLEQLGMFAQVMGFGMNQTQTMFSRFNKAMTIMGDALKIMKQLTSDLTLMVFLWIGIMAMKSWLSFLAIF